MVGKMYKSILLIALLVFAAACGGDATSTPAPTPAEASTDVTTQAPAPLPALALERMFPQLEFGRLTGLAQAGLRFFAAEQIGRVTSLPDSSARFAEPSVFLDIRSRVSTAGNEEGLLGFAFDPDFESKGHFYVYYFAASPRRSVISRFTASDDAAMAETELVVLTVPQPFQNHNGGQIAFGPDGMLYISLGDGGSGGDPQGNGQDLSTLLGTVLRIDVSEIGPDQGYQVPPDKPFVGVTGAREEIWAYGLRNPWRLSFDRENGALWAGDVGQDSFEEVNLVRKGGNYGWNTLEGNHCYSPRSGCDPTGTEPPVLAYGSDKGCSVIGGYVYHGAKIPSLAGVYLYGDYCSGEVRGFRFENGEAVGDKLLMDSSLRITSFSEDHSGEIYILTQRGHIYRLIAER